VQFILIRELRSIEPGVRAEALASFPPGDPVFEDHFPGFAIVPGTLLTEAMGQTGGWLIAASLDFRRWPLLTMVERAKFRKLVLPGEEICIEARLRSERHDDFQVDATARVGPSRVADARLVFHTFDFSAASVDAGRMTQWARSVFRQLGGDRAVCQPAHSELGCGE
jgi:3-hydroxyacyl-[acyl-carrier-protein] dehydratase